MKNGCINAGWLHVYLSLYYLKKVSDRTRGLVLLKIKQYILISFQQIFYSLCKMWVFEGSWLVFLFVAAVFFSQESAQVQ